MKHTILVIPDSGPLISLSVANRLDLLFKLDMPIYVIDQVFYECTKDLTKIGARAILEFVTNHPEVVHLEETFVGRSAKQERIIATTTKHRGLGEAAIAEFLANLDDKITETAPVLVLFEDSDIRRINAFVQGNVHLLSTKARLIGMEECGIIASAEEVWQAILNAGRVPSAKLIVQPSPVDNSHWKPLPNQE